MSACAYEWESQFEDECDQDEDGVHACILAKDHDGEHECVCGESQTEDEV